MNQQGRMLNADRSLHGSLASIIEHNSEASFSPDAQGRIEDETSLLSMPINHPGALSDANRATLC
jgi:hypothetical protein